MTVQTFSPIRLDKGQFRISLNLTDLGERSPDILLLIQEIGFPPVRLQRTESAVWAILVDERHDFETDSFEELLEPWDSKLDELRNALPDPNHGLLVLGRFKRDLG